MKKWMIFGILFLFCLFPIISATTIDSEIQKLTHYAEEYETGNIDYVQLLVYLSSARQNLNELVGVVSQEEGGIVKQEQLRPLLGEPQEETKWVWVEGEERDKKLDEYVPIWRKIVFDGNKIQIRLNAHPSLYVEKSYEFREQIRELKEQGRIDEIKELEKQSERKLVYRLHFETEFKKETDKFDINSKIDEVQILAELFNKDPSSINAENLAEESVNVEKSFGEYYRRNQGTCEDIMKSVFGSENLRETVGILSYDIAFYEEENLEARINLEMCEECEWNWINMHMWIDGRGKFKMPDEKMSEDPGSRKKYEGMSWESFESETANLIMEIQKSLQEGDYGGAMSSSNKLRMLTDAWNQKSNDVWEEADNMMQTSEESMGEKERQEFYDNYGWLKREQEKRGKLDELRENNFEKRRDFYLRLFASYEKRESYVKQTEFEKRLIEEFREVGGETCDNNKDDNNDGNIDCADSMCGGQFCGTLVNVGVVENQSIEQKTDLFCIKKVCQQKDDFLVGSQEPVCGNNICEENETLSCAEDCASCPMWDPIPCNGKLIFSGKDETGCKLAPICIEEDLTCEIKEDCVDPLCGEVDCIKNTCQVIELEECRTPDCVGGDKRKKKCGTEELIIDICVEGLWKPTGVVCESEPSTNLGCGKCSNSCFPIKEMMAMDCAPSTENFECVEENNQCVKKSIEEPEAPFVECVTKNDCGGENDVCSNGECVTLPPVVEEPEIPKIEIPEKPEIKEPEQIHEKPKEIIEEPEQENTETPAEVLSLTGQAIFGSIRTFLTGQEIEGGTPDPEPESIPEPEANPETTSSNPEQNQNSGPENNLGPGENEPENGWEENENNNWEEENEERQKEDKERRKDDCKDRCSRECNDRLIRPCAEDCAWEACGKDMECDLDEVTETCEKECKENQDLDECEKECNGKCMKNENTWVEMEQKTWQEEKGVFNLGGGCRQEKGQTNAYLWFGGWGDPFDAIQPLKDKYYSGGHSDWCGEDLENLQIQRKEFEKSFNQEFAVWFFEDHLSSAAEEWEQHQSGIFELYWSGAVEVSRQLAERMQCLGMKTIPFDYKLINFSYETEYGSIEYWEEIETINPKEFGSNWEESSEEIEIITPYMKVWIFPPKEFLKYELEKAMVNHEFPGSPEDKIEREKENGPSEEEKQMIKQDQNFMKKLTEISDKYNGNVKTAVQFKDYETDEIVFNLYVQINEEDIMVMEPMLPEEVTEKDVTITVDFNDLYELIHKSEKDMSGARIETPYWVNRNGKPIERIKEITNGIQMMNKVRKMANNAVISPEASEKDVRKLLNLFFKMMLKGGMSGDDKGKPPMEGGEEGEKGDGPMNSEEGGKEIESMGGHVVKGF